MPMSADSGASTLLENAGLRATRVRLGVLSSILSAGRALSHRELVDVLGNLDRVTVYRNLKLLKEAGLVHGVQGMDGVLRYVVNLSREKGCPGGHPHFLCLECGAMSCLANQVLPRVSVPKGCEVHGKQFLVYGLCRNCASSK